MNVGINHTNQDANQEGSDTVTLIRNIIRDHGIPTLVQKRESFLTAFITLLAILILYRQKTRSDKKIKTSNSKTNEDKTQTAFLDSRKTKFLVCVCGVLAL